MKHHKILNACSQGQRVQGICAKKTMATCCEEIAMDRLQGECQGLQQSVGDRRDRTL